MKTLSLWSPQSLLIDQLDSGSRARKRHIPRRFNGFPRAPACAFVQEIRPRLPLR